MQKIYISLLLILFFCNSVFAATRDIVPRATGEGSIGTSTKEWASGYFNTVYSDNLITKGPIFDVKAYGAVGDDSTDDTIAIQAAIDAAEVNGGIVFFPIGIYKTTSALSITKSGVSLKGTGITNWNGEAPIRTKATLIKYYGTTGSAIALNRAGAEGAWDSSNFIAHINIEDLAISIDSPAITDTTYGIRAVVRDSNFSRILIQGFKYGMYLESSIINNFNNVQFGGSLGGTDGANDIGLYLNNQCNSSMFNDCFFHNNRIHIKAANCGRIWIDQCTFEQAGSNTVWGNTGSRGITVGVDGGGATVHIENCYFEKNDNYRIYCGDETIGTGSPKIYVERCYWNDTSGTNIYVKYGDVSCSKNDPASLSGVTLYDKDSGDYEIRDHIDEVFRNPIIGYNGFGFGQGNAYATSTRNGINGTTYTVNANQSDYIEINLGGNANFGIMLMIAGAETSSSSQSGLILAYSYGYLNNNSLLGELGTTKISGSGSLNTDITVGEVAAKGSGNIIRIPLTNGHATRNYIVSIMLFEGSANSGASSFSVNVLAD